jgi:hypothetical protein
MLREVGVTDWFRRLFSPAADDPGTEDEVESEAASRRRLERLRADGVSGFAGLEVAEAAENAVEGADLPPDPAP